MFIVLLLLYSRATQGQIRPQLPAPVTINKEAGRGGHLTVTLRLESGKELPFEVDTGSPATVLDKSLEPQLGKRLGRSSINWWNRREESYIYAAPRLYLGSIALPTAARIFTSDLRAGTHTMGVLGMDCLKHYCIQLDFAAGKMRFLDSAHLEAAELGKAFPLTFAGVGPERKFICPMIHHDSLAGENTNLVIDTGCNIDGLVNEGAINGTAMLLQECVWERKTYTNLIFAAADHVNVLGLSFLARHLVTLDFPDRIMYLKQTSIGPLAGDILMEVRHSDHRAMVEAYFSLIEKGQLPGLSNNDKGAVYLENSSNLDPLSSNAKGQPCIAANSRTGPESVTFCFQKNGYSSTRHYKVTRASEDSPWKLQKAWRTDEKGQNAGRISSSLSFETSCRC